MVEAKLNLVYFVIFLAMIFQLATCLRKPVRLFLTPRPWV